MKVLGDLIIAFLLIVVGAALIAGQFACTIDNALEKHKKEQEKDEKN
jgi:hypothetical protein